MNISDDLNQSQKNAVLATEGPVLLLAGPGSGKTLTLVRRTLHIIQSGLAKPEEIILCSFTEKSAHELKERVARDAIRFGISEDLSGLVTGTIHSICNDLIDKHLHATQLGNNYDLLDETTQLLFIYKHFKEIVDVANEDEGETEDVESQGFRTYVSGKYKSKWEAIKKLAKYFDKITEELVDPYEVIHDSDAQTKAIAESYIRYREALTENNKIDFAHLQKVALELLRSEHVSPEEFPKYIMVDEFQDTNFIQERLVAKLASASNNLCVVGDEDQSLYRFRGATVENILTFPERYPEVEKYNLDVNYRSEPRIVDFYSKFIESGSWVKNGRRFRYEKDLEPVSFEESDAPSVVQIHGELKVDSAKKTADFIKHLMDEGHIADYSQVAILLNSVQAEHSGPFTDSLQKLGIKSFCPRAKAFFSNDEVGLIFASFAYIFDWDLQNRGTVFGRVKELAEYVDLHAEKLSTEFLANPELKHLLDEQRDEIRALSEGETLDKRVADYIFILLAAQPFQDLMLDAAKSRNMARMTQFLSIFHQFYKYPIISHRNLEPLKRELFSSYFSYLLEGGADDYEDPDYPFPLDHVQIMTIHQSKGLEFPVIITGNLNYSSNNQLKEMHERLGKYMPRTPNEPPEMIGEFDSMRLFYVAFSRAQNLLVLASNDEKPLHKRLNSVLPLAKQITNVTDYDSNQVWTFKPHTPLKKSYSFTSDIKAFESCSRQYSFFKLLEFSPSRAVTILFGTLVHQTIEDIHRLYIRGQSHLVNEEYIETQFNFNYRNLQLKEVRSMAEPQKAAALRQVVEYWKQNKDYLELVKEAEVDVSLEKDNYILAGSIDLVANADGSLEILDFKTGSIPDRNDEMLHSYYKQLCIYAHIYQNRTGLKPDKLVLYWTGEYERDKARMVFPYVEGDVENATEYFEAVVREIQAQNFAMEHAPDPKICNECDFKAYCKKTGLIE